MKLSNTVWRFDKPTLNSCIKFSTASKFNFQQHQNPTICNAWNKISLSQIISQTSSFYTNTIQTSIILQSLKQLSYSKSWNANRICKLWFKSRKSGFFLQGPRYKSDMLHLMNHSQIFKIQIWLIIQQPQKNGHTLPSKSIVLQKMRRRTSGLRGDSPQISWATNPRRRDDGSQVTSRHTSDD